MITELKNNEIEAVEGAGIWIVVVGPIGPLIAAAEAAKQASE